MNARILNTVGWILSIILFAVFAFSGITKILPIEVSGELTNVFWDMRFASWELPVWLPYFVGGLELLGATALLIPGLRAYAGIGFTSLMIGAIGVYLTNLEPGMVFRPVILGGVAAIITWIRRYELFYYIRRRNQP